MRPNYVLIHTDPDARLINDEKKTKLNKLVDRKAINKMKKKHKKNYRR